MKVIDKVKYIYHQIRLVNDEPTANPGLTEAEITNKLQQINISPVAELVELYQWHNGINYLDAFLRFLSLEEAIEQYKIFQEINEEDLDFGWKTTMFPIIDINGDTQYCIDLEDYSVTVVDLECDLIKKASDRYDYYLDAIIYVFENQLFSYDSISGSIKIAENEWNEVAEKFKIESVIY